MVRRYNLRRSDNSPFVGQALELVTVDGTVKVDTGFPVTSAIVSHVSGVPTSALRVVSETLEKDLQSDAMSSPLEMSFSCEEPMIIHSMGIDFSRGNVSRQIDITVTTNGVVLHPITETASTSRNVLVGGPFVLSAGDSVRIFADVDESIKSSSSSYSTLDLLSSISSQSSVSSSLSSVSSESLSSVSSESLSSQTISLSSSQSSLSSNTIESASSESSSSVSSEKSSLSSQTSSSLSSVSSQSSLSSVSSKSSSSKNSSSSSSISNISSNSSSSFSSSSISSVSSISSESTASSESSESSSTNSSSSSTGHLRAVGWIKYSPCTVQFTEYGGLPAVDEAIGLEINSYLDDGFLVSVTGIVAPTIVRFSYMAV